MPVEISDTNSILQVTECVTKWVTKSRKHEF